MRNKTKHFVIFITIISFISCQQKSNQPHKISGKEIKITDSIKSVDSIEDFVAPYREHIEEVLDEPLAYNPTPLAKNDGNLNSSIGNLMADITFEQSNPIFKKRTGENIDFVLLNHGGIRATMSKGNVSRRTAYEIMPFENKVVVLELSANKIKDLVSYLAKSNTAHPVSKQFQLILNDNNSVKSVTINGKPLQTDTTYFVATSDYLATGGDHMDFFKNPESATDIDYLLRNELIDYFEKIDTIRAQTDNRFIKI
ncbi:5'-nucleotidase C-terminal domain-containing protein [Galbibacter sp. BG1]|uniref:5'-nucleotidase C-terminal domain-containing protein n=1 Tax=Galbibacter sp. BG1 TaxID=1170699 RepID=UPI0015BD0C52|nr:5'-nucleotidase [Galbibacter sp. BG1]QLE02397.1 5'-nucleotidase C-terminal domain-containing protein [Galbibacter sp. BG1]